MSLPTTGLKIVLISTFMSVAAIGAENPTAGAPLVCSAATLHGSYGFGFTGIDNGVPYSSSGMESYDGQGHVKYFQLWNESGTTFTYNGTAAYTITAGCIATVVYDNDTTHPAYTYFVSSDGSGFFWNNNQNTGLVSAGREDRLSLAQLVK